jgi:hypothetical protein
MVRFSPEETKKEQEICFLTFPLMPKVIKDSGPVAAGTIWTLINSISVDWLMEKLYRLPRKEVSVKRRPFCKCERFEASQKKQIVLNIG